jgi:2-aminoadipate transaminase
MFCWLEFPEHVDTAELLPRALAAGVGFVPGAAFTVHADQTRAARCCFASVDEATLTEAVARLAACVS